MKQAAAQQSPFRKKLQVVTRGQQAYIARTISEIPGENGSTIVDYVAAMISEINPTQSHIKNLCKELITFSKFHKHKPFKAITRDEVQLYLESYRKPESDDPSHKWIGTFNVKKALIVKFYRWLFAPGVR